MLGRRFIRWASDYSVLKESLAEALTSLLRRYTPVPVGSSSAEDLASTHLTSSLIHPPVIAPTLQLDTVGSSGATGSSPRGLSPVQQIAPTPMRRFIRCQPDRPVLLHRIIRCHWFLQNSSISIFLEFFLRVLLGLAFLLHPWDLLMFT